MYEYIQQHQNVIVAALLFTADSIGVALNIYYTSLESLDLQSLTAIRNGGVLIKKNARLCYVDTIDWQTMFPNFDLKLAVLGNGNSSHCGRSADRIAVGPLAGRLECVLAKLQVISKRRYTFLYLGRWSFAKWPVRRGNNYWFMLYAASVS